MSKTVSLMKGPLLRLSCLLFSVLSVYGATAQTVTIQVVEQGTQAPLANVEIFFEDFTNVTLTNDQGIAIIDTSSNSNYQFALEGYNLTLRSIKQMSQFNWKVALSPFSSEIEEIILLGQHSFKESDKFRLTETITSKEIQETNPQTSADVLSQNGNVYIQKSQMGGGSPIIRGFEANRVLLVVDGVRMNNAIYRNGHLQNAITVDASAIENVKVLFGPNSLAYGSDAIGGVVAYSTKIPLFGTEDNMKVSGNSFVRYSSANHEKTIHGDVSLGWEKWALLSSVTLTDYDDLRAGSNRDERFPSFGLRPNSAVLINGEDQEIINPNPLVQIGTGYHQYDFLQKAVFKPKENIFIHGNVQYSTTGNVPRYDNLQETRNGQLRYGEWNYGPQSRFLTSFQVKNYINKRGYDQYIITGAYQKINEDRIVRNFQNANRSHQEEDVHVFSFTGEFTKSLNKTFTLLYGFDSQFNRINSQAFAENITNGTIDENILSRYANGDNEYNTYGLFSEIEWTKPNHPFSAKAGLRYSVNQWHIRYENNGSVEWPSSFTDGIDASNNALTWSISGIYDATSGLFVRSMISSAFRAPNIDDLSKIRVNSMEITFPNVDLSPEKSISTELSLGLKKERFSLSATSFFTTLKDAITRRPFTTPEGSSTYINFGETLNVVANQNTQKAHIYGLSLNGKADIGELFSLSGTFNITRGKEKIENNNDLPFAHIPPLYGNIKLAYHASKWNTQFVIRYNGQKDIDNFGGSVDNPDLATPIGSLAWTTYSIYSSYEMNDHISANLGIENILDKHYRPFGSGVSAAGRNFILSMRYTF